MRLPHPLNPDKAGARTRVWTAYFAGLAAFFTLALLVQRGTHTALSTADQVTHTQEVLLATEELLSQLRTAESSQRGCLLSQDAPYLDNYRKARGEAERHLRDLRALTADNPLQQEPVRESEILFEARWRMMDQTVVLAQEGRPRDV